MEDGDKKTNANFGSTLVYRPCNGGLERMDPRRRARQVASGDYLEVYGVMEPVCHDMISRICRCSQ